MIEGNLLLLSLLKFIKTLKNKIYKYLALLPKNMYINNKLDNIVNKYNNTYCSTVKMKLVDLKSSAYIDFSVKKDDKKPK